MVCKHGQRPILPCAPRHATQRLPSCRHPSKTKQPWSLQEHQQHNNRKQRSRWEAGFVAVLRDRNLADQRFKAQACQQGTRLLRIDDTKLVRLDTGAWLLLGFFGVAASCIQRAGVGPPKCFRKLVNNSDAGGLLVGHFGQAPENSLAVCKVRGRGPGVQTTQGRTCRRSPCWQSSSFPDKISLCHRPCHSSQHLAIFWTPKPNLAPVRDANPPFRRTPTVT